MPKDWKLSYIFSKNVFLIFRNTGLSSPKIKKIHIFSSLSPQNFSLKNFLYFFLKNPALKKFLIFFSKKSFSYIFWEMELSYIFSKKSFPYVLWNGNFFRKKVFLMFREMELFSPKNKIFQEGTVRARKMKKTPTLTKISYISGDGTFVPEAFKKLLYS